MEKIFGKEGYLTGILPFYEYRESQETMARKVYEAIEKNNSVIIEAPTGVGKTLAYLIPALHKALSDNKTVAVSTETKSLQKQIIDKDIPLLKKIFRDNFGMEFRSSLCLGSSNYPCRKRLEVLIHKGQYFKEYKENIEELLGIFSSERVITKYDVNFDEKFWGLIQRDSEICNFAKCHYSSSCIFHKVRKEWRSAHLLIMNHYLFFSNMAVGKTYLPHFDFVIFDEAHSVESIASRQMGFELSRYFIKDILNDFYDKKERGLLANITDDVKFKKAHLLFKSVSKEYLSLFNEIDLKIGDKSRLRLQEALVEGVGLSKDLSEFISYLDNCEEFFQEEELEVQFDYLRARLFTFLQNINMAVYDAEPDWVYWLESNNNNAVIKGMPIEVNTILHDDLYPYYDSVIFTSATISVNGDFSFFKSQVGADFMKTVSLESPFDYEKNLILYLPSDLPEPGESGYVKKSAIRASEIIEIVDGNCLFLFTSYEMLENFRDELSKISNREIFSQGDMDAIHAVNLYKETPGALLMGTHSFWQGLDLPGDLLRAVVMMRLPFSVPDRPDLEAKVEKLKKSGGNPFMSLFLPEAVIKFKQGFGRLIRKEDDSGLVAVFDKRIKSKQYGKFFLKSTPASKETNKISDIVDFYKNR